jgi:hypothetical protein
MRSNALDESLRPAVWKRVRIRSMMVAGHPSSKVEKSRVNRSDLEGVA